MVKWIDRQIDEQIDRQIDRQKFRQIDHSQMFIVWIDNYKSYIERLISELINF